MKKKILTLLFILFITSSIFSQLTSLPSSAAFQSTKYTDANVNESSGRVTTSIPICNYQVGRLQVPISLNYVGNGVKVSQQSNWVGTNWNLNAGGVVTRIVNGYPDEKASARFFLEDLGDPALLNSQNYILQPGDTRDYRADIFSFSFPGYSGSFYLDKNLLPRLTNNDSELKIEFLGGLTASNTNTILITTPNGIKYFFGGVNASENSSTLIKRKKIGHNYMINNFEIMQSVAPLATTSFYLYKIENNYSDQIVIDYYDDGTKDFILSEQQTKDLSSTPVTDACPDLKAYFKELKKFTYNGSIHNSKKINRIYSSSSDIEIKFISEQLLLPSDGVMPAPQYNDRILKGIQVYNNLINQNIKNIILDHLIPTASSILKYRFFLDKVSINNSNLSTDPKCEVYKMEYNNPEDLPSRFSNSVDLMGYYNGASNLDFIENNYYESWQTTDNLTNRDSNFELSTKGALKKIYYPTGGYSNFEYEKPYAKANTIKNIHLNVYTKLIQEAIPRVSSAVYQKKHTDSYNVGVESENVIPQIGDFIIADSVAAEGPLETGFPPITINEDTQLNVIFENGDYPQSGSNSMTFTVFDLTTNTEQSVIKNFTFATWYCDLKKDHKYTFALFLNNDNSYEVNGNAYLNFKANEYLPASGIRIKRITEMAENQKTSIKRFYYKKAYDIGKNNDNSGVVIYEPNLDATWNSYSCDANSSYYNAVSLNTNPFATIFSSSDNQLEYRFVTTSYGGDSFELGGIEKHFKIEKNDEVALFYQDPLSSQTFNPENEGYSSCSTNNKNLFNGTLLKEIVLEKKGNSLFVKEEKDFTYDLTIDHEIQNFVLSKIFQGTITVLDNTIPSIGKYSTFSYRNNLKEINTKTYTNNIPVGSNPIFPDFIATKTNFEYTVLRGLPSAIITKESKGKTLTKRFYYPVASNVSLLSSLLPEDATNYSTLESQNNISTPIQIENYIKDVTGIDRLLLTKRKLFKNFSGKILPYTEQVAKQNFPLHSNSFFTNYDLNGNLLEVNQENQFKKSTLYGYNNSTIIAELPNVAYTDIQALTITTLKNLSNIVVDQASMIAFETQLNFLLRTAFPDSQITTYVYNFHGLLNSVTDARGRKMTYVYDDCKQLKMTVDNEGNIIEEYKYNRLNN